MDKFRYEGPQSTIRSGCARRQQFELQVYRQAVQEMSDQDTPPPNLYFLRGDEILEVEPQRLKDETCLEDTKLTHESLIRPLEPSAASVKLTAIRQTVCSFSVHLGLVLFSTLWFLSQEQTGLPSKAILQISAIFSAVVSFQLLHRLQERAGTVILGSLFLLFSCSLPVVLATAANVVPAEDLQHACIQLLAVLLGICIYATTTSFDEWSECEELLFALAPCVFASVIMMVLFTDRYIPVVISGVVVGLVGLALRDCSKDTLIPATSLSQRLLDVVSLYRGAGSRLGFIVKAKVERLIEKPDIL